MKDCNRKRKTPIWSGQDVLSIGINQYLSEIILEKLNAVRVWPKGFFGLVKKFRCFLKMGIKHDQFGNLMLAAVIANTVVMALNGYGISEDMVKKLEMASTYFTWIFIVEMAVKLVAIGI
jgi:hypothetical protein